MTMDDSYT